MVFDDCRYKDIRTILSKMKKNNLVKRTNYSSRGIYIEWLDGGSSSTNGVSEEGLDYLCDMIVHVDVLYPLTLDKEVISIIKERHEEIEDEEMADEIWGYQGGE